MRVGRVATIAVLAVAGLPALASPAGASKSASVAQVQIINLRDRVNFDVDEIRDGDDFRVETRDQAGDRVDGGRPEFRWVLDTGAVVVTGNWVGTERRAVGSYRVKGPSRTMGADSIRDTEIGGGTWRLEARLEGGPQAVPETVQVAESEISIEGGSVTTPAGGRVTVSGVLQNTNGALPGRAVKVTYTRPPGGDSRFHGGGNRRRAVTNAQGRFSVVLDDPDGSTWELGSLRAIGTGEESGDRTQLPHRYGPDDAAHPRRDATDTAALTWQGSPGTEPVRIAAGLRGHSKGAKPDRLRVTAPRKARGAAVRLFRVQHRQRTQVRVGRLDRRGDKAFRVTDRNRSRVTTYVAEVGPTLRTRGDATTRRRVR